MNKAWWLVYLLALNVVGGSFPLFIIYLPLADVPRQRGTGPELVQHPLRVLIPIVFCTSVAMLLYTALSGKRYRNRICSALAATVYPIWTILHSMTAFSDSTMPGHAGLAGAYIISFVFVILTLLILTPVRRELHHFC